MAALYDKIGVGYSNLRKPDDRIAKAIHDALGDAQSVLNVGAGTGSYEPTDREVTALEPSVEMINQRSGDAAKCYQGVAEDMPFDDNQFDAAMAILTVHHWSDMAAGFQEMHRVTKGRLVILTFDPEAPYFWLAEYVPEIIEIDQPIFPKMPAYEQMLGNVSIAPVLIPHDCSDGFLGAYWRRPHAYLDPKVRASISTFPKLGDVSGQMKELERDLESGDWNKRHGHLMNEESLDAGYRLVVTP